MIEINDIQEGYRDRQEDFIEIQSNRNGVSVCGNNCRPHQMIRFNCYDSLCVYEGCDGQI
jgi:hypothetical protein